MKINFYISRTLSLLLVLVFFQVLINAQTTTFTYQGSLPAERYALGRFYQMTFSLFDSNNNQIGSTIEISNVKIVKGRFKIQLDFGAAAFSDGEKFLEVRVRSDSNEPYTVLENRQPFKVSPYLYRQGKSDDAEELAEFNGLTVFGVNQSGQNAPFFPGAENYHVVEIGAPGSKTPLVLAGGSGTMEFWSDRGSQGGFPPFAVSFGMAKPGNPTSSDMVFSTYSPALSWQERMRISATGNIGIGTSSPTARLEIAGGDLKISGTGGIVFPDGTKLTTATTGGGNGSGSFINNSTTQQASANFNISGNGTAGGTLSANVINAQTQYNIADNRVFTASGGQSFNTFAGIGAGPASNTGFGNSFFGADAGKVNNDGFSNTFIGFSAGLTAPGSENTFIGSNAGQTTNSNSNTFIGAYAGQGSNSDGGGNTFVGIAAGRTNSGSDNSYFGKFAGLGNSSSSGIKNSFFGTESGRFIRNGSNNSFFGNSSGLLSTTGNDNTFLGYLAGRANTTGSNNTALGQGADFSSNSLSFATAIGSGAIATTSNSVTIGRAADRVNIPGQLFVAGVQVTSDRNAKTNFRQIDSNSILKRLAGIPIQTWNYKSDNILHIGPVAQDFKAAFGLGIDEKSINTVDADGVAFAAIQALYQKSLEKDKQIEAQQQQLANQEKQINALKQLVCQSNSTADICKEKPEEK